LVCRPCRGLEILLRVVPVVPPPANLRARLRRVKAAISHATKQRLKLSFHFAFPPKMASMNSSVFSSA
jgi:hypothetical protein